MEKLKMCMILLMAFSTGVVFAQSDCKKVKRQKSVKTTVPESVADTTHAETQTQGNSSGGTSAWPLATGTTGSVIFKPDTASTVGNAGATAEQNGAVSGLTSTGSSSTELTGGGNKKNVTPDSAIVQKRNDNRKRKNGN